MRIFKRAPTLLQPRIGYQGGAVSEPVSRVPKSQLGTRIPRRELRRLRREATFGKLTKSPDARRAEQAARDWCLAVANDLPKGKGDALRRDVTSALVEIAKRYGG